MRVALSGAYRAVRDRRRLSPLGKRILAEQRNCSAIADPGPRAAVAAAVSWLCRAQDKSRSADGGVARHFSLLTGWGASYPETTGYIVPTLLAVASATAASGISERCRRMLDWLVSIQLPNGAFQAGSIDAQPVVPSTFNTGQILLGLAAVAEAFGERRYVDAMHSAARFLRDGLDADGCWRRFPSPFAKPGDKAYETHAAWGLFEAARVAPNEGYGEAAIRQVRWALTRQVSNGWFEGSCLTDPEAPLTHTLGYTLRGVIEAYRITSERQFLESAILTADALAERMAPDGYLAGRWDRRWNPRATFSCLTGAAQIAACWFLLAGITGRQRYTSAALRANAFVRSRVKVVGEPDVVGGVPGSYPIDGEYGRFEYPNWAAKFFIDANLLELSLIQGPVASPK